MRRTLIAATLALLPAMSIADSSGNTIRWEDYKGKVVYVDFWASWCGPCRQSFPWLIRQAKTHAHDNFEVIAINVDADPEAARDFLKEFTPDFRVVFDAEGKLAEEFKVESMPSSYLIDKTGKPRFKHGGFFDAKTSEYEHEISQLLRE